MAIMNKWISPLLFFVGANIFVSAVALAQTTVKPAPGKVSAPAAKPAATPSPDTTIVPRPDYAPPATAKDMASELLNLLQPADSAKEKLTLVDSFLKKYLTSINTKDPTPLDAKSVDSIIRYHGSLCRVDFDECLKLNFLKSTICMPTPKATRGQNPNPAFTTLWTGMVNAVKNESQAQALAKVLVACSTQMNKHQFVGVSLLLDQFIEDKYFASVETIAKALENTSAPAEQESAALGTLSRLAKKAMPATSAKKLRLVALKWASKMNFQAALPVHREEFFSAMANMVEFGEGAALADFVEKNGHILRQERIETRWSVAEVVCAYWKDNNQTGKCRAQLQTFENDKDSATRLLVNLASLDRTMKKGTEARAKAAKVLLAGGDWAKWGAYIMALVDEDAGNYNEALKSVNQYFSVGGPQPSWGNCTKASILIGLEKIAEAKEAIVPVITQNKNSGVGATDLLAWSQLIHFYISARQKSPNLSAEYKELKANTQLLPGHRFLGHFADAIQSKYSGPYNPSHMASAKAIMGSDHPDIAKVERWIAALPSAK